MDGSSSGKHISDTIFTRIDGTENEWRCYCLAHHKVIGTGYSTFTHHIQTKHPEAYQNSINELLKEHRRLNPTLSDPAFLYLR